VCASGPNFDGCGKIRALAEPLEEFVGEVVIAALDGPELVDMLTRTVDDDPGVGELERLDAKLAELAAMWADGELDRPSWRAARERLEKQRAEAEAGLRQYSQSGAVADLASDLRSRWPTLSLGQRRAVLDAVLESVTVGPAVRGRNTFDANRVTIRWKV